MLLCIQKAVWLWDFQIPNAVGGPAEAAYVPFGQNGSVSLGDSKFEVKWHGFFSQHWTLERDGRIVADGQFSLGAFSVTSPDDVQVTIKRTSLLRVRFDILTGGKVLGTIRRTRLFPCNFVIDSR